MSDLASAAPDPGFGLRLADILQQHFGPGRGWGARLGRELGVSRVAVFSWVHSKAYPEAHRLIAISALTGCSLDWLLMGRGASGLKRADLAQERIAA